MSTHKLRKIKMFQLQDKKGTVLGIMLRKDSVLLGKYSGLKIVPITVEVSDLYL